MPTSNSPFTLYRPARQKLTQMETIYAKKLLTYDYEPPLDTGEIDFIERATNAKGTNPLLTRRIIKYFKSNERDIQVEELDFAEFEITYSFPFYRRPNMFYNVRTGNLVSYGSGEFSYRMLYEFLCLVFNDGDYFIDSYLKREFKNTNTYIKLQTLNRRILQKIAEELRQKKVAFFTGRNVRLRGKGGRFVSGDNITEETARRAVQQAASRWSDFTVWRDSIVKNELVQIGEEIRQTIITALSTGNLPLKKTSVTPETERKKRSLGFDNPSAVFYASGQLIENLSIYIALDKEAA